METKVEISQKTTTEASTLWKNARFLYLWAATTLSTLAINFFRLALPLIIYDLTQSTLAMSTMRALELFPMIVLGMLIGVLIDRYNRKGLMIIAVSLKLVTVLMLIYILSNSSIELWHLYILGFLFYTAYYVYGDAVYSTVPLVVNKEQLVSTNSIRIFTNTLMNIGGPALAGIALFSFTYTASLSITLIIFLILLIFLSCISFPAKSEYVVKEKKTVWEDMKEGWNHLIASSEIKLLTIIILATNIASTTSSAVLIFYSVDVLNLQANIIGIIFSSIALGGLLASLLAKKIHHSIGRGNVILGCLLFSVTAQLLLFISWHWYIVCGAMLLTGFSIATVNIYYSSLIQEQTPSHLLGRVTGTSSTIVMVATPISFLIAGLLGEVIDVRYIFLGSSVLYFLIFVRLILSHNVKKL